jgi:hypothetical protein
MEAKYFLTVILFVSQQGPVHSADSKKSLYCAKGNTLCGNFNEFPPNGYKTSGGGICGGDPIKVLAPDAPGANYSAYWCGSYFIGAVEKSWSSLKPV